MNAAFEALNELKSCFVGDLRKGRRQGSPFCLMKKASEMGHVFDVLQIV